MMTLRESNDIVDIVRHAWGLLGEGKLDELASLYSDTMIMVIPGQKDVISGKAAFRVALDGIADALPPGFDITAMRYCAGEDEVMNVVEWKSDKIPEGTQSAILWKFDPDGLISEERWYIDTDEWKSAF